jgi:small neutral amino acid transporter SnatA (MarC family)
MWHHFVLAFDILTQQSKITKSPNQQKDRSMIGQILPSVTELATPVAITPIFINAFVVSCC